MGYVIIFIKKKLHDQKILPLGCLHFTTKIFLDHSSQTLVYTITKQEMKIGGEGCLRYMP